MSLSRTADKQSVSDLRAFCKYLIHRVYDRMGSCRLDSHDPVLKMTIYEVGNSLTCIKSLVTGLLLLHTVYGEIGDSFVFLQPP